MIYLLCFLLAWLCYLPCIKGPFMFDDPASIHQINMVMSGDWKRCLKRLFRGPLCASYALQVKWFGVDSTVSYHLVNIGIHAVNGWIIYVLLRVLDLPQGLAVFGATVFIVHPMNSMAVANINGRSALLSSTFWFAAITLALSGHAVVAVPVILLAMWTKEDTVMLPFTIAAIGGVQGHWSWVVLPIVSVAFVYSRRVEIRKMFASMQFIVEPGLTDYSKIQQPDYSMIVIPETIVRFPGWALGVGHNVIHYLREDSFLSFYGSSFMAVIGAFAFLYGSDLFRIALILTVISPAFLYGWFRIKDPIIEHRNYASSAGIALLYALLFSAVPAWTLALVIGIFFAYTALCASLWSKTQTLDIHYYYNGRNKSPMAALNAGAAYQSMGRLQEARDCYAVGLLRCPEMTAAKFNLAIMKGQEGDDAGGIAALQEFVREIPNYPIAWDALAVRAEAEGDTDTAIQYYTTAAALAPNHHGIATKLALRLFYAGRPEDALHYFQAGVRSRPDVLQYRLWLAQCLLRLGRDSEGIEILKTIPRKLITGPTRNVVDNAKAKA